MKLIAKILFGVLLLYVLTWAGLAAYFSIAERHKGMLEANLSTIFKRDVSIEEVHTAWSGLSPVIQINGFKVAGDTERPALAFKSMSAELAPMSLLRFWPKFSEFAVDQPSLEIVSLPNNKLQIAGITLNSNRSSGLNPKKLISWLLNHQSAVWLNGEIVWQRRNGDIQRYSEISFVYQREEQERVVHAASITPKGPFAFKAESRGDILETEGWDASLEVMGLQGEALIAPDDLSLKVSAGQGRLLLKTLNVQRIRDLLLISGLGNAARWLLDSELSGRLHDVSFEFSGPLLEIEKWTMSAFASEIGFLATETSPGLNNLAGKVSASADGGTFEFSAQNTLFSWSRWFDNDIPIDKAHGQFHWSLAENGEVEIVMADGLFEDEIAKISDINASITIDRRSRNISNLAQLFKIDSVADLSFEEGGLVENPTEQLSNSSDGASSSRRLGPLFLDASAKFELHSFADFVQYLPNDRRLTKLKTWWENAFLKGTASNGRLSYQGELTKNAIKVGKAQLNGSADFSEVAIDYGYQRQWPKLLDADGHATLDNDTLTILPETAWLEADRIDNGKVVISSLFDLDRKLDLTGSTVSTLPTVMEFLFDGPLLPPEQKLEQMPITATSGRVSADVEVSIPLRSVIDTEVKGVARISAGELVLPQGVPMHNVAGTINFTEKSADSDLISSTFLGGETTAKLITTEEAKPPKMKVVANGTGEFAQLEPWVGEHMLSWMNGVTDWQGEVDIDGPVVQISTTSKLKGVAVSAPQPLAKPAEEESDFSLFMQVGSKQVQQKLRFAYGNHLRAHFQGDMNAKNTLLDQSLVQLNESFGQLEEIPKLAPGVNFSVDYPQLDLDYCLASIIELAQLETKPVAVPNTDFLDAMRTVKIVADDPVFLGRQFGAIELSAISVDGAYWIASLNGDNVNGTIQAEPRTDPGSYRFKLSRLHIIESQAPIELPEPIDRSLQPSAYPSINLSANSFMLSGKPLGSLNIVGSAVGDEWQIQNFELIDQGIKTIGSGGWVNNDDAGSFSKFQLKTVIEEAGDVLDDMEFAGFVRKGDGSLDANINWIGAPHEFDFARLNGDFDLRIRDGELVKVEPGSGKLVGLFNVNAIARRLIFDFRDVFSSGLQFDRMRFAGLLANGEAIMRDAYVFTPAVFIQMEGKLDLGKELIDMEIHASPELGGNLALLSALANPAAGAVVFLTQQIFKDQVRSTNISSYRAFGTWEDFELEEFDEGDEGEFKKGEPENKAADASPVINNKTESNQPRVEAR